MGLFDLFRASPEKRIEKAKKALEADDPAMARDHLDGLDGPEADAIRRLAFEQLVLRNLEAAVSWAEAGDDERVRIHLELADEHHLGGLEEKFRDTRRRLREIREAHRAEIEEAERRKQARMMQIDPLHTGPGSLSIPGIEDEVLGDDKEELRARLALLIEGYPEDLRSSVDDLGADFARAALDLEEGRPDLALQALVVLSDDAPLVRWERARCAHMLGDPKSAARELRAFANLVGGHKAVGNSHSGLMLAQCLAQTGDPHGGLRVVRDLRATDPRVGGVLFAQLLAATEQFAEADSVLRALIKNHPLEASLYKMLAGVRIAGGERVAAMRALEQGLHQNHCASGTCSARPPDVESKRLLATLYLEDGLETQRALQLLEEAPLRGGPSWDDLYVEALAAKARRDDRLPALLATLRQHTPEGDPRAERLQEHFPA